LTGRLVGLDGVAAQQAASGRSGFRRARRNVRVRPPVVHALFTSRGSAPETLLGTLPRGGAQMDPERLAGLPLFTGLDDRELGEIAACTREVTIPAGATIAAQGQNAYEFFLIESGEADVQRDGEVIASVRAGDVVGEIGLLVTGTRTASIVATTPMTLVAMFVREFKQIEKRMPEIAGRLRETIRERVARTPF
jgi:CRP/FNR family cyclic AMP-dependent transcriptional regulator